MWIYYSVHYLFNYIFYLIIISLMIISAVIFKFRFYMVNAFGSYAILLALYGHVLIAGEYFSRNFLDQIESFLVSIFFNSKKTASVVGYVAIVVLGLGSFVLIENLIGGKILL